MGPAGIWGKGRTGRPELSVVEVIGSRSWVLERSSRRVCKDSETIYEVDAHKHMLQSTQDAPRSKKVTLLFKRETKVMGQDPQPCPASPGRVPSLQKMSPGLKGMFDGGGEKC